MSSAESVLSQEYQSLRNHYERFPESSVVWRVELEKVGQVSGGIQFSVALEAQKYNLVQAA